MESKAGCGLHARPACAIWWQTIQIVETVLITDASSWDRSGTQMMLTANIHCRVFTVWFVFFNGAKLKVLWWQPLLAGLASVVSLFSSEVSGAKSGFSAAGEGGLCCCSLQSGGCECQSNLLCWNYKHFGPFLQNVFKIVLGAYSSMQCFNDFYV